MSALARIYCPCLLLPMLGRARFLRAGFRAEISAATLTKLCSESLDNDRTCLSRGMSGEVGEHCSLWPSFEDWSCSSSAGIRDETGDSINSSEQLRTPFYCLARWAHFCLAPFQLSLEVAGSITSSVYNDCLRSERGTYPRSILLEHPRCRHCGCRQIRFTSPWWVTDTQAPLLLGSAYGRQTRAILHWRGRPGGTLHRNLVSPSDPLVGVSVPFGLPSSWSSWWRKRQSG